MLPAACPERDGESIFKSLTFIPNLIDERVSNASTDPKVRHKRLVYE